MKRSKAPLMIFSLPLLGGKKKLVSCFAFTFNPGGTGKKGALP